MALVMVLGVIVVLELMALHLVVISEVTALEAKVVADRTQLKYAAESGVDRAYWMLLQNLSEPSVESSETSLSESDLDDLSSWKTDARPHELEAMGFRVQVTLSDASAGLDVSGKNPRANLESLLITGEPDQEVESVQEFLDVLTDYVDARNGRSLHGKEQEDYAPAPGGEGRCRHPGRDEDFAQDCVRPGGAHASVIPNSTSRVA